MVSLKRKIGGNIVYIVDHYSDETITEAIPGY